MSFKTLSILATWNLKELELLKKMQLNVQVLLIFFQLIASRALCLWKCVLCAFILVLERYTLLKIMTIFKIEWIKILHEKKLGFLKFMPNFVQNAVKTFPEKICWKYMKNSILMILPTTLSSHQIVVLMRLNGVKLLI
jgi:hypothetical protein